MCACQVFGYPYARKRVVEEYLHQCLSQMNGQKKSIGRDEDGLLTFRAIEKEINALQDLWLKESVNADNPLCVNTPWHVQMKDQKAMNCWTARMQR